MIAHVRGTLLSVSPACVVSVGGVGLQLKIPEKDRALIAGVKGEVAFHTYLYVREDRLTLYGFLKLVDRDLFNRLIEVTGIGPKIALGMLSDHTAERIVRAVQNEDHAFLCKLPGLGRRTAERLTVELKDKLGDFAVEPAVAGHVASAVELREEAMLALTSLGMPRPSAERALEHIDWKTQSTATLPEVVKQALKHASGV
jgi:Holliday junction DNA helicase RuvA